MEQKDCQAFSVYMDDMIDGQADESVRIAFNDHLSKCEKCRTKYEIYCKIREILTASLPVPSSTLPDDISHRLDALTPSDAVKPVEPKKRSLHFTLILSAIAVLLAAIVLALSLFFGVPSASDDVNRIHLNEQGEVQKKVLTPAEGTDFINDEFFDLLKVDVSLRSDTFYTYHQVLNALESIRKKYDSEYGGIVFVLSGNYDIINKSEKTAYYPDSASGVIAFFTYSGSYELFTAEFTDLYEEFYLDGISAENPFLVVVCLA